MLETYILPAAPPEGATETIKPSITVLESTSEYASVALEPLVPGFAHTIGNPLRRFLLSSIRGSAITWVKIDNVVHEYTAIEGVKEEVMDLLLNIKRIRIHAESERTGKMRLDVQGEGRVCAGDIATSSDFEIVNPELHLATLDGSAANLSIEFNVESGLGYRPATQSEGSSGMQVGVLPVDAIFNPVRKVNYTREPTRVGQRTDYERLVLELWTDGTIAPLEALGEAASALVDDFFLFKNLATGGPATAARSGLNLSPEIYQTPIERLELSHRTLNCLKRAHITRVGEVLEMSDDELLKIRNFGEKSLSELRTRLEELGVGEGSDGAGGSLIAVGAGALAGAGEDADDRGLEGISLIQASAAAELLVATDTIADGAGTDDDDSLEDDLDYDFEDDEEEC
ncbi:MAG: DNA-directed RNA polymerase subunit alpha [Chloroflexota bacterium]|nr:DNA-directed RNA polymerase subunit alpha [Chloroflexota bacterium]